ncbi:hypothetical protein CPAR01_14794 [Colletotrichum paranaense]|uniref:Uncharacterized protein n=2 Tax=Colletotrichum acutatum species complex TaxID=2707335 RepID=A0AAI9U8V0_9PEZI|nr:uncharacterized protein CPAR01_14794 [Colletotrichum paranaense]KAK1451574.1 hypothetical protein CMEL01_06148 [Colletotrichum melonis]KAK1521877.1 hypothetical protein CPAR01_14794 [Colletotrichum paranaense]
MMRVLSYRNTASLRRAMASDRLEVDHRLAGPARQRPVIWLVPAHWEVLPPTDRVPTPAPFPDAAPRFTSVPKPPPPHLGTAPGHLERL